MNDISSGKPGVLAHFKTFVQGVNVMLFGSQKAGAVRSLAVGFEVQPPVPVAHFPAGVGAGQSGQSWPLLKRVFNWRVGVGIGSVAFLVFLLGFSLHLAGMRIYQVDECCNVYPAKLLQSGNTSAGGDLFQILLSWLIPRSQSAVELFSSARLVMVVMFWLNWLLLASATGARVFSGRWLIALVGAATLAPLWDYGFEVRHDNLLLTGILLMWGAVRFQPAKTSSYFLAGVCAVALEFVASKAFVYTIPISVALLLFPQPGNAPVARRKLVAAWLMGAVGGLLIQHLMSKSVGLEDIPTKLFAHVSGMPANSIRFWPWESSLPRLLVQTPLLVAATVAALMAMGSDLLRKKRAALVWEGYLPEAFLFSVALAALFINPNPYPYNLLHLVPYAFLLAFRYSATLWDGIKDRPALYPGLAAVLIFAHLVPFGIATKRHLNWPNARQETLMSLAEGLTDSQTDPVYDAAGIVATRPIIHPRSFIHGQHVQAMLAGGGPQIRDMLKAKPAAVIIPNYRTDWLSEEDHSFIKERYVAVADDFLVLGKILPPGGGTFEIVHPGRYRLSTFKGSDLAGSYGTSLMDFLSPKDPGTFEGALDAAPVSSQCVELSVGSHHLKARGDQQLAVVWVGPNMDRIGRLAERDHRRLFYNWY